ncbi:GNAT family N-acetyltransferase [Lactococcus nasutitermitis]|uniref:GNAT family N-acetyltransferase n=1 Tax=Lactococcus nasutitermitis TaxID=1652957 RepID=A0ABV9JDY4_9LACT|nr:GNAT family N-acetyltransferase [Lactococcus nasutitermitis]
MEELEIRRLKTSDNAAFQCYAKEWTTDTSPFHIDETDYYKEITVDNFENWLDKLEREETKVENPDWSTAIKYFAVMNGKVAGVISCRWQIEKGILLEWGGHIGYGVAPSFRGQGLAAKMLAFALEKYRKRGILCVMVSADEGNIASRKTIEKNGGVLENIVDIDDDRVCRYWIDLEKR